MATATWGRGRSAGQPDEIPKTGWKDTLTRVKVDLKKDRMSMVAAAMAYYALFAIVPALSALVMIYAWFSDPAKISIHLNSISQFIPEEMRKFLDLTLSRLSVSAKPNLGLGALVALFISLWSASQGSKALIEALNIIYKEEEKRGFFRYTGLALGLTLLAIVLCILALVVVVGLPTVMQFLNLGTIVETGAGIVSWVLLLGLFSLYLSIAYQYSPCRRKAKWKWVSWGAIIASLLWAITSGLFSWYVKEFADFNKTYGPLGAIIVLMTWFYISSYVVLLGAEINAELEHRTVEASTDKIKSKVAR